MTVAANGEYFATPVIIASGTPATVGFRAPPGALAVALNGSIDEHARTVTGTWSLWLKTGFGDHDWAQVGGGGGTGISVNETPGITALFFNGAGVVVDTSAPPAASIAVSGTDPNALPALRTAVALMSVPDQTGSLDVNSYMNVAEISGVVINDLTTTNMNTVFLRSQAAASPVDNGNFNPAHRDAPLYFLPVPPLGTTLTGVDASTGTAFLSSIMIFNSSARNGATADAPLTIKNQDARSLAVNRFDLPGGQDIILQPGYGALFVFNGTTSRWNVLPVS